MEKQTRTWVVEMEIPIEAKREFVWDALINDISLWWRKDFMATGADNIVLEPKVGGRMYEDLGDGAGLLWYTVEALVPNNSLLFSGVLGHDWGGPARTMLSLKLEDDGQKTKLKIFDSYIGHITDKAAASFEPGWNAILKDNFKAYVEKKAGTTAS